MLASTFLPASDFTLTALASVSAFTMASSSFALAALSFDLTALA
jgi:hypothetical protein